MAERSIRLRSRWQRNAAYSQSFYASQEDRARRSARPVVRILIDLVAPKSVIDVGCGTGAWLREFSECGVDIIGVDFPGVADSHLSIPADKFVGHDLRLPLALGRRFDLVLSLEVAEHLSEQHAASFVAMLTDLAPVVAFSAAIPHQGGQHHINEQWPEYWEALFRERGFVARDVVRPEIWLDQSIEAHYRQNILLFVDKRHQVLLDRLGTGDGGRLSRIHPEIYLTKADPRGMSLRGLLRALPLTAYVRLRLAWARARGR